MNAVWISLASSGMQFVELLSCGSPPWRPSSRQARQVATPNSLKPKSHRCWQGTAWSATTRIRKRADSICLARTPRWPVAKAEWSSLLASRPRVGCGNWSSPMKCRTIVLRCRTPRKKTLRQWLDGGAAWSLDVIDPAVYLYGDGAKKHFVQRLTMPEYIESVRSTLSVDIAKEARESLPRDLRADGFSNTAYNLNVDLAHIEAYAKLAEIIAGRVDIKAIAGKHTKSRELTDENLTNVIEPVGRLPLRGPLSKEEITRYWASRRPSPAREVISRKRSATFWKRCSSRRAFVYRIERHTGDGSTRPADQYELASRLSYILWGGPPDEELLRAADKRHSTAPASSGSGKDAQRPAGRNALAAFCGRMARPRPAGNSGPHRQNIRTGMRPWPPRCAAKRWRFLRRSSGRRNGR